MSELDYMLELEAGGSLTPSEGIREMLGYTPPTLNTVPESCPACGERSEDEEGNPLMTTWQQWQCQHCGSWNDR